MYTSQILNKEKVSMLVNIILQLKLVTIVLLYVSDGDWWNFTGKN